MELPVLWRTCGWFMVIIVIWGSLTPSPPEDVVVVWDKALHLAAYAILAWWFVQAWERRRAWLWALFLLALGALLEWLQGLGGSRMADPADMIANGLGVLLGVAACWTPLGRGLIALERLAGVR